jgi:hypothetical protein
MSVTDEWLLARQKQEQKQRVSLANEFDQDPDRATRVISVGFKTGLPQDVVEADLEGLESQLKKQEFNYDKYLDPVNGSPVFAEFAAKDPNHLAVLKRDEKSLGAIERAFKPIFMGLDSTWARNERIDIWDRRMRNGDFEPGDEERLQELKKWDKEHDFGGGGNWFSKLMVRGAKELGPTIKVGQARLTGYMAGTVAGGTMGLAATSPIGGVGLLPGAAMGGLLGGWTAGYLEGERMMTAEQFGNLMEQGIPEQTARIAAQSTGAVAGVMESFGVGGLMRNVPGLRGIQSSLSEKLIGDVLARESVQKAMGMAAVRVGEGMLTEIGTEVMQTSTEIVSENFAKKYEGREDLIDWEQYKDAVADTVVQTFWGVGLIATAGPTMRLRQDMYRVKEAKQSAMALRRAGEALKDSNLRKDLPGTFRKFVEALAGNADVKNILIAPERFDTYFQENGVDPDEVLRSLGVSDEEIQSARELGWNYEIPITEYFEKIGGTEAFDGLLNDIKADVPDSAGMWEKMTAREAEEYEKLRPELEAEIESLFVVDKELSVEDQELSDITDQLIASGTEPNAAKKSAIIMKGFFNLDERRGYEKGTLLKRMFAGVKRSLPEGMGFEDVDILVDPLLDMLRTKDFPTQREMHGQSLLEMMKERGGLTDEGGELAARDFGDLINKGTGKSKGDTLDGMAEAAYEAGFIAERDPELLMEAIEKEKAGTPVYGTDSPGDPMLRTISEKLEELSSFIQAEDIDIDVLSNPEIRKLLEGSETFNQEIDTNYLKDLQSTLENLAMKEEGLVLEDEITSEDPVSTVPARAAAEISAIYQQQDFGNVQITDTLTLKESGETVKVTDFAQAVFTKEVKRRNILRKLWKCVSGS